jgi:hypothetical protein
MSSKTSAPDSIDALMDEVECYLGVVEYFRSQGCEPHWSREPAPGAEAARPDVPSPHLVSPRLAE